MKTPAISVLIPIYNAQHYLPHCLSAIHAQTFQDIEIICVNDGSTDSSTRILHTWNKCLPSLRVVSQSNRGVAATRNRLLIEAKGTYICFIDSDDIICPDYLEKLYCAAQKENADITKCFFHEINAHNQLTPAHCSARFYKQPGPTLHSRFVSGYYDSVVWGKLFRRELLQRKQLSFLEGHIAEDFAFVTLSFMLANRITYVPEFLYHYRKGTSTAITSNGEKMAVDILYNLLHLYNQLHRYNLWEREIAHEWIKAVVWSVCRFRKFSPQIQQQYAPLQKQAWNLAARHIKSCQLGGKIRWGILFMFVNLCGWKSVYGWSKCFR